jgi:hypothetical protein
LLYVQPAAQIVSVEPGLSELATVVFQLSNDGSGRAALVKPAAELSIEPRELKLPAQADCPHAVAPAIITSKIDFIMFCK